MAGHSLSLWIAEHYPNASNSTSQRDFILKLASERSIGNIDVVVCDMNDFSIDKRFDRVLSIEMFEHMRNYGELFVEVAAGRAVLHARVLSQSTPYEYVDKGPAELHEPTFL